MLDSPSEKECSRLAAHLAAREKAGAEPSGHNQERHVSAQRVPRLTAMRNLAAFLLCWGLHGQTMDPITDWATVAAYSFHMFPSHDTAPVGPPGIVYHRAGGIDLKLDVITP